MGFLILGCSLFLLIKGVYSYALNIIIGFSYVKKIGQVVGFSEEKPGVFRTVIRFLGIDGKDYYLIDGQASSAPPYASGEFVRILLSKIDLKKGRFDYSISSSTSLWYLFGGAVLLGLFHLFFVLKIVQVLVLVAAYFGFSELAKFHKFFHFFRFEAEFKEPKIIGIEFANKIAWSDNYHGHFETESSFFAIANFLLKAERLFYITCSFAAMISAFYFYQAVEEHIQDAHLAPATYDRPLNHQWAEKFQSRIPLVHYYTQNRSVISVLDKQNPFYFGLKNGSKVTLLISKKDPKIARIDRGHLNHWRSYTLFVLSLVFMSLNKYAMRRNARMHTKNPVIRIRKAG